MYRNHHDLHGCGRDGTDRRVSQVVLQNANFLQIAMPSRLRLHLPLDELFLRQIPLLPEVLVVLLVREEW